MEIKEYTAYEESEVFPLYSSVGWTAYTQSPETLKQGFENSLLTMAAYEGDTLLGIIRTVGDGHTIVYIQDILVFPEYQRKGIGTALIQAVLERFREVRQIMLTTDNTPKTIGFYTAQGFAQLDQIGCCGLMRM